MAMIRQRTQVFNKSIGVVRANAGGAKVGQAIASAADTMAQISFERAAKEAEKRGFDAARAVEESQLTTFNAATGKPEAFKIPTGFGDIAGEAYQRVIDSRFEQSVNAELQLKAKELAIKYEFNPEAYSDVFSDYIGQMSENAEGHYKTLIEFNGTKLLESTALTIKKQAIARSRARLAQSALDTSSKYQSEAYESAKVGAYMPNPNTQMSDTDEFAARDADLIKNGVDSNLLKPGADKVSSVQMNTSIAQGALEHIAKLATNSSERNLITLAIRRGTTEGLGINPGLEANVTALLRYVSADNRSEVLRHHDAVSSDYNAVEADMIAESKAVAAANQLQFSVFADQAANSLSIATEGSAYLAFQDPDTNINGQMGIPGAVGNSSDQYSQLESQLGSRIGPGYTLEAYKGDTRDARQALLKPYLLNAATQGKGSVEDLRLALTSLNQRAFNALDSKQQQLVVELRGSSFFDLSKETTDFVSSTLNGIVDKEAETKAQIEQNISLMDDFNSSIEMASNGSLREEDYNKLVQEMRSNIRPNGFTLDKVDGFTSELDRARASSFITEFAAVSPKMNSYSLNMLQQYINLKGQGNAANFPSNVKQFGDYILDAVSKPDDLKSVSQEINSLEATYAAREEDERKQLELAREIGRVGSGQGNMLDAKDRKIADQMLDTLGIDLSQYSQMPDDKKLTALNINRFTAGQQSLIDPLARLASGLQVSGAESYIQMYAQLSNDMSPASGTDVVIDRFGSGKGAPLSETQKQRLNDILTVYSIEGGDINVIAAEMAEKQRDGKAAREAFFVKNKQYSGVRQYLATLDSISGNSTVIDEMVPVAEYLIGNGLELDEVQSRIDQIIDKNYDDSLYIIDPMSPSPRLNKSKAALTKTIPDAEARSAFLTKIEAAVSSISIDGRKLYLGTPGLMGGVDVVSETGSRFKVKSEDRIYLRPDPAGGNDRYYLYYMDNNELKPLIYSADAQGNQVETGGENYFPSFSIEKEVGDLIRFNNLKVTLDGMQEADRLEFLRITNIQMNELGIYNRQERMDFLNKRSLEFTFEQDEFEAQQEGRM